MLSFFDNKHIFYIKRKQFLSNRVPNNQVICKNEKLIDSLLMRYKTMVTMLVYQEIQVNENYCFKR